MRVLVICPVFPPEPIISAQTTAQIAETLAGHDHQVTVITAFPNRPAGKLYPGYRRTLYRREAKEAGYEVLRCFSTLSTESQMLSRFAENISFGVTSGWAALTTPRPEIIYANSWPVFATGILALVARLRGIPLVISVQDIYPESLIAQGRIPAENWLARLLATIDRRIAHSCQEVVVISERFAEVYRDQRKLPAGRLHVIPNWVDEHAVPPEAGGDEIRAKMGIPADAFLLVYGGNIGAAAGVEGAIQALDRLSDDLRRPYLLVAGAGANLEACRTLAARIAGDRVRFYTPWPTNMTGPVYSAADVLLLPTQGRQSLVSAPSKLISYMLSGRPVIAQAIPGSDTAQIIEDANCGWVVEPEALGALAALIREVMALPLKERTQRGRSGREYALSHLTKAACLPKVIDLLEQTAGMRA